MERTWLPLTLLIVLVVAAVFFIHGNYATQHHERGAAMWGVLALAVVAIGFSKMRRRF